MASAYQVPLNFRCSMPDETTMRLSFLAGFVVVISLLISWYLKGDPLVSPQFHCLVRSAPDRHAPYPQLNAIPTVGFSGPILSYFSALQFSFDSVRMLKEGYGKVNCLPPKHVVAVPLTTLTMLLL
jgi:hypothetical protein